MTVVSQASKTILRSTRTAPAAAETSEFDGFWINLGVYMGSEDDAKFVRLPRGIAVSDLKIRKVYETMDPDFAAQVVLMNQLITLIQQACVKDGVALLKEGESRAMKGGALQAVLYRRQEESAVTPDATVNVDLEKALFGI
jgi:hypothetical protein